MDNVADLVKELRQRNAMKVMIQLPEGLKVRTAEMAERLGKEGIVAVFSGDASYGACDLKGEEAKEAGCDLLVHVGHNKFYRSFDTVVPVLYFPWIFDVSMENVDFSPIKEKRIGIVTNIQHLHLMEEVKKKIEKTGVSVLIGGQVLGCWTANAVKIENSVDCFLFIGSGVFHSLALKTEKPVYVMDMERNRVEKADLALMEKRRYAQIFSARDARTFCVLVSTKKGQDNLIGNAERIRQDIEKRGKSAFVMIMDEITDNKLRGIRADAFINTACPRLLDDTWHKPFVNATDVEKIFE